MTKEANRQVYISMLEIHRQNMERRGVLYTMPLPEPICFRNIMALILTLCATVYMILGLYTVTVIVAISGLTLGASVLFEALVRYMDEMDKLAEDGA